MTDSKQGKQTTTNEKRRKVLKTAGVAGGVVATGAHWHKPILDAVLLPAHAQTSMAPPPAPTATVLTGGSSTAAPITHTSENNSVESIASRVMNSLIPEAHAEVDQTPGGIWRGLVGEVEDYQHCVSLTLPAGESAPTSVDVSLEGPTVYYDYQSYSGSPAVYYYSYTANFTGTSMATPLTENAGNFEFSTIINGVEVCGSIDATLTTASGALILDSSVGSVSNNTPAPVGSVAQSFGDSGYGAYWSTGGQGSCTPGAGESDAQLVPTT